MARFIRTGANDRLGWHRFYAKRFDTCVRQGKDPRQAEHLSLWYLILHLADGGTYEH